MSLNVYLDCPCCGSTLFDANITHNLNKMAQEAGLYRALWRPEEIPAKTAKEIRDIVANGLAYLIADPDKFRKFDSPNGWGTYDDFVPWVQKYLIALDAHPDALVNVSR